MSYYYPIRGSDKRQEITDLVGELNKIGYNKKVYRFLCDFYHCLYENQLDEQHFRNFYIRLGHLNVDRQYKQCFMKFFRKYYKSKTYYVEFLFLLLLVNPDYKISFI